MTRQAVPIEAAKLSDPLWRRLIRLLGRAKLGNGTESDLVDWAVDALSAGWQSDGLAILAGLAKPPNGFEVDRYVERMMVELGVEMPDPKRLAMLHAVAVAGDVLAATASPYEGAREMYQLWLNGSPKELQPWAGLEDEYELARDGVYGDTADVERRIRDEAWRVVSEARGGGLASTVGMAVDEHEAVRECVDRAINALKMGCASVERCIFCGGIIDVAADPPGGPYTQFRFACPCNKCSGFLKGL